MGRLEILKKFEENINYLFKIWLTWAKSDEGVDNPKAHDCLVSLKAVCMAADSFRLHRDDMHYTWSVDDIVDDAIEKIKKGESELISEKIF